MKTVKELVVENAHLSVSDIAEQFNVSRYAVAYHARSLGIKLKRRCAGAKIKERYKQGRYNRKEKDDTPSGKFNDSIITADQIMFARKMLNDGFNLLQVSRRFCVSPERMRRLIANAVS